MRHIRTAVCQHPGEPGATNDQPASHGRGPGGTLPGGDVCRDWPPTPFRLSWRLCGHHVAPLPMSLVNVWIN